MGNIDKTIRYLKRNGLGNTYYAVKERLFYKDVPFNAEKEEAYTGPIFEDIKFSILVPVYETRENHLKEMIDSVLAQIYGNFELILADASKSSGPETVIKSYDDERIKYVRVKENKGISENTNVALEAATGEYCGLLDHDDLLTPDALYENALMLSKARRENVTVNLLYSDEDKCNSDATKFYGRHYKQKLNLDLLMSNNYICHFSVIRTELLKSLRFRSEYNGSQDHDLLLRVVGASEPENVIYIRKVLYHWRCHEASTAFNPASKEYAYTAGRKAIRDFIKSKFSADVEVRDLSHKGFYEPVWGDNIFEIRKDVGAIGHLVSNGRKITTGVLFPEGDEEFLDMNVHYSGYMHRAHLYRDVFALDIRTVTPREEMEPIYREYMRQLEGYKGGNASKKDYEDYVKILSIGFGHELKAKGLKMLYAPGFVKM